VNAEYPQQARLVADGIDPCEVDPHAVRRLDAAHEQPAADQIAPGLTRTVRHTRMLALRQAVRRARRY
jgi:hypothetical protein